MWKELILDVWKGKNSVSYRCLCRQAKFMLQTSVEHRYCYLTERGHSEKETCYTKLLKVLILDIWKGRKVCLTDFRMHAVQCIKYTHWTRKLSPLLFSPLDPIVNGSCKNCCVSSLSKIFHPNMMLIYCSSHKLTSF